MSYRIDPRLPLTFEVQRIAAEEIDDALGHLAAAADNPDKALHACRKRLKSIRALLRLVRPGDEAFARAENARYRDVSARLAGARQATALIETLDRLADAFPKEAADGALDPVRERLVARRGGVLDNDLAKAVAPAVAAVAGQPCRDAAARSSRKTDGAKARQDLPDRSVEPVRR